jgi:soluble lytic murein transglycosylase
LWPDPKDQRAGWYLLGKALIEQGDPTGVQWIERLPKNFDDLEDRRLVWLAKGYLVAKDPAKALPAIEEVLDKHPDAKEADALRLARATLLHEQGRDKDALKALSKVGGSRERRARALRLGIEWGPDDPKAHKATARQLLIQLPETAAAREPSLPLRVEDLSDADRFQRAQVLQDRWEYAEARDELRRLLKHPKHGPQASWDVAYISLRKLRDDPEEARALLKKILASGDKKRQEEGTYLLMRTYLQKDRYDEVLKVADQYDRAFPKGQYRDEMAYYRGWLPYDRGDCVDALPKLRRYLTNFGEKRSYVEGFEAWCYIRMEKWDEAIREFGQMLPLGNPVVRGKAHYWRAYAFDKLGKRPQALAELDELHKLYPLSYYDMLGLQLRARFEGRDPRASLQPWPEGGGQAHLTHGYGDEAWSWPKLAGPQAATFARIRRLVELGEIDAARALWRDVRGGVEGAVPPSKRLAFMYFMGDQVEDYRRGWEEVSGGVLAAMSGMPDPDDVRWVLAYPRAYAPLVEHLGREFDIPGHFVYAIMRQESRYSPAAVSATDAVGALQMIPPTAKRIAADMGLTYDQETFPRPQVGFRYSLFYMRKLASIFQDQWVLTAASYNGGPKPIARWLRQHPDAALPFLVEEFAYNESRTYCRKVAEHMLRYLYLYEPDPAQRAKWLDLMFPTEVNATLPPQEPDY